MMPWQVAAEVVEVVEEARHMWMCCKVVYMTMLTRYAPNIERFVLAMWPAKAGVLAVRVSGN